MFLTLKQNCLTFDFTLVKYPKDFIAYVRNKNGHISIKALKSERQNVEIARPRQP